MNNLFIFIDVLKELIPQVFKIIIAIGKSVWRSTLSIVNLVVYSFLLYALIAYYTLDMSPINSLIDLTKTLIDYWVLFWWMFFASNLYDDWRWRR